MIVKAHPFAGTARALATDRAAASKDAPNYESWVKNDRFYINALGECALVWTLMERNIKHDWDADYQLVTVFIGGVSKKLHVRTAVSAGSQRIAMPLADRDRYLKTDINAVVGARWQEPNRHVDLLGAVPRGKLMELEVRYPSDGKAPKVSQAMAVIELLSMPVSMNFLEKLDAT